MHFLDLPVEIGTLIISYLDTKSKIVCFKCRELRGFFAPCLVKRVTLSRSNLANISTLNQELFVNYADSISELNLYGAPNLTAEDLEPHIFRLKNLTTLDIAFTSIFLSDLPKVCGEKLKNISINFFKNPRIAKNQETWYQCKTIFIQKKFVNIHFIVFDFNDSESPQVFLKNVPEVLNLKVTVADNYRDFWGPTDDQVSTSVEEILEPNFEKLFYVFRDCRVTHKTSKCLKGVTNLNFNMIEFIFVMYLEKILIYSSPIFKSMFVGKCSDFTIEFCDFVPLHFMLDGNIVFKAWNKLTTQFNANFFAKISTELEDYFPTYFCMHSNLKIKVMQAKSTWLCLDSCDGLDKVSLESMDKITLTEFCRKDGSVLRSNRPVTLSADLRNLKNLTFLRLSNVRIRENFFFVLFTECLSLHTLDIYVERRSRMGYYRDCSLSLSKTIHLANKLKNVKFTADDIDYELLFEALSKCVSLENIHVCEYERALVDEEINVENMILAIKKCVGLYSLFIEADISPEGLTLMTSPLREAAQKLNRDHLCLEVCDCYLGWNPFVDVFNPSPLHILD